jgi:hypothetical protein
MKSWLSIPSIPSEKIADGVVGQSPLPEFSEQAEIKILIPRNKNKGRTLESFIV